MVRLFNLPRVRNYESFCTPQGMLKCKQKVLCSYKLFVLLSHVDLGAIQAWPEDASWRSRSCYCRLQGDLAFMGPGLEPQG